MAKLAAPMNEGKDADFVRDMAKERYANSTMKSLKLVIQRELLLWWRDKYQLKAKIGQNLVLGVIVGTLFWDASVLSLIGVMFQSMFVQVIGAMLLIVKQFPYRAILYKQQDANFFPTWTYAAGRSVANIPNSLIDSVMYGTMIFWFTNMAYGDGASILPFFMFLIILFMTSYSTGLFFGIFPACVAVVTIAQAAMAVLVVCFILFSGFAIQPDVIPNWYIWAYWINPLSWVFRALAVNEFDSGAYDEPAFEGSELTLGEQILITFGFTDSDGDPYDYIWVAYGIFVLIGLSFVALVITTISYIHIRFATGKPLEIEIDEEAEEAQIKAGDSQNMTSIPFERVDLTFKDMHYTVQSSITKESLELLKGIDGVVEAGKMTALMGSSGAGKTTLMDVLAMRKSSGVIEGEVRLNGHLQEEQSFRRAMGYVEQFDVQSEQLTIRETVEFSAKLRLDASDPTVTPESTKAFVDATLAMLELTPVADLQVGSDETGGLSFEQRKRLSIAVELVANPSILFLDEPTSGLDARAAMIVMRGLKRIASSGRAVCATIHQPSVSIFSDFDSLLLLKRGGEVVFHGELGEGSSKLIEYLERFDSTPKIQRGENPATWMLTTIGAGSSAPGAGLAFDYSGAYRDSKLRKQCLDRIDEITSGATDENKVGFSSKYATSYWAQSSAVLNRTMTLYFRTPNYNITRNVVSVTVAILFGTCYINYRTPSNESEMSSVINSVFIAILFLCVGAENTVLNVFEKERNMFYRHKAASMYDSAAVLRAHTLAELPFIFICSMLFTLPFYFMMGFAVDAPKFFLFYCFTYLGFNLFTFSGQMFMSLVRDAETAQAIGGLFVTVTVLFSGLLIRPDEIPVFWEWAYWVFPGHYLFQGLFLTQFHDDDRVIEASDGSPFYLSLGCSPEDETVCEGTISQWIATTFSDWDRDNVYYCGIYLAVFIVLTRLVTFWALTSLNYRAT
uniref:ABC transporter domain-containing protein n=1 Tax=Entomoneis paludosa TaxID=265537 RepID=A0A7S2YLL6_9STRA